MATPDFKYAPMFQLGKDTTEYRLLSKEGISVGEFEGKKMLKVSKEALTLLAQKASCLSVRIPAPPSSMVRKDSRYGRASRMRKRCHWVFTTPIHRITCATLRMHRSTCMMR